MSHNKPIITSVCETLSLTLSDFIFEIFSKFTKRNFYMKKSLALAISKNEITPYLQPIFDSSKQHLIGVEILMRWVTTQKKVLSPDIFIPHLEELSLMSTATCNLITNTMFFLKKIEQHLPSNFHVSLNISAASFDKKIYEHLCKIIQDNKERFDFILEITETSIFQPTNMNRLMLEHLHSLGAKIAIDDFGTGYSGLSYFNMFNIDIIKIDKIFVNGVEKDNKSKKIIENIIDLASRMNTLIIAEGVENISQRVFLEKYNIYLQQGFLYSRPLSKKYFIFFLLGMRNEGIDIN